MSTIDINDFEIKKELTKKKNVKLLVGRLKDDPAIVKVEVDQLKMKDFEEIKLKEHKMIMSNDVYKSYDLEIERDVSFALEYPLTEQDLNFLSKGYEIKQEKFEEYLASEVNECNNHAFVNKESVFENDDITIYDCSELGRVLWIVRFKNLQFHSIRDLNDPEVLERAKNVVLNYLNIPNEQLCLYFEYRGKEPFLEFNVLDISKSYIQNNFLSKFIFLDDLIKNMKIDLNYYKSDIEMIVIGK